MHYGEMAACNLSAGTQEQLCRYAILSSEIGMVKLIIFMLPNNIGQLTSHDEFIEFNSTVDYS